MEINFKNELLIEDINLLLVIVLAMTWQVGSFWS